MSPCTTHISIAPPAPGARTTRAPDDVGASSAASGSPATTGVRRTTATAAGSACRPAVTPKAGTSPSARTAPRAAKDRRRAVTRSPTSSGATTSPMAGLGCWPAPGPASAISSSATWSRYSTGAEVTPTPGCPSTHTGLISASPVTSKPLSPPRAESARPVVCGRPYGRSTTSSKCTSTARFPATRSLAITRSADSSGLAPNAPPRTTCACRSHRVSAPEQPAPTPGAEPHRSPNPGPVQGPVGPRTGPPRRSPPEANRAERMPSPTSLTSSRTRPRRPSCPLNPPPPS